MIRGCSTSLTCVGVISNSSQSSVLQRLLQLALGYQRRPIAQVWKSLWCVRDYHDDPYIFVVLRLASCRFSGASHQCFNRGTAGALSFFASVGQSDGQSEVVGPGKCPDNTNLNNVGLVKRIFWVL